MMEDLRARVAALEERNVVLQAENGILRDQMKNLLMIEELRAKVGALEERNTVLHVENGILRDQMKNVLMIEDLGASVGALEERNEELQTDVGILRDLKRFAKMNEKIKADKKRRLEEKAPGTSTQEVQSTVQRTPTVKELKKKGACFVCYDLNHFYLQCPVRREARQRLGLED